MAIRPLARAQGNWVVGDTFFNRERELELFKEHLHAGGHFQIIAQRRIGKTSLMKEAARRLEGQFLSIYVDLEKAHSPEDAIVELGLATRSVKSVWGRIAGVLGEAVGRTAEIIETVKLSELSVTLRSGLNEKNWGRKGDELLETLSSAELPAVLFLDEVPILVNRLLRDDKGELFADGRRKADALMSWLRAASIKHKGLRIVVTGSIGLEPILQQAGLNGTLNTFVPVILRPWSVKTAKECLESLALNYGLPFESGAVERMVELLGSCIPHHVQMFFTHVYSTFRIEELPSVTVAVVDHVYDTLMIGTRGHAELSHMEERLKSVLGPSGYPLALDLLTEAASVGVLTEVAAKLLDAEAKQRETTSLPLSTYLAILEHDGYLRRTPKGYEFESNLLRDWWKRRFDIGFVTSAVRAQRAKK